MDDKLRIAIDALLEIKASKTSSDGARQTAKRALAQIWCDYYRFVYRSGWSAALPAAMVD